MVLRIDGQPLSGVASSFIRAQLDRQSNLIEGEAEIARAEDSAIPCPGLDVSTLSEIKAGRIDRIESYALRPGKIPIALIEEIRQWSPLFYKKIVTVCATNVSAHISQSGNGRMRKNAGDKSARYDLHIFPAVALGLIPITGSLGSAKSTQKQRDKSQDIGGTKGEEFTYVHKEPVTSGCAY